MDAPHPRRKESHVSAVACEPLHALEHIRRMRGGSQPHLMRCSDRHYYVVKFQNNPQDRRVLVNELLGTLLARRLGLPAAAPAVVYVPYELVRLTDELRIEYPRSLRGLCQAGPQFGSRYVGDPRRPICIELMPDKMFADVVDYLSDFAGMLVFDKWTCNTDGRQVIFQRRGLKYRAVMIDQGFCFNSGEWSFPDAPLRGRYARPCVYDGIFRIEDFDPWLSKLESQIDEHAIRDCAAEIPPEWYDSDTDALARLLDTLNRRRGRVRELLWAAQRSSKDFLRNWVNRNAFAAAD
jgi:HipA-like kinase